MNQLSQKATELFEGKIPFYARARQIDLNQPSEEIDALKLALHLAFDEGVVSRLHPEWVMAAAIVTTYCRYNGGFCPTDWVANLMAQMYPHKVGWFSLPMWILKRQNRSLLETLYDGGCMANLAINVFRVQPY